MGHYDSCRDEYCGGCGAAPGNMVNGVCPFCKARREERERQKNKAAEPPVRLKKKDKITLLRSVVQSFIDTEIAVESSGDNGRYNVEEIPNVVRARAALEATKKVKA